MAPAAGSGESSTLRICSGLMASVICDNLMTVYLPPAKYRHFSKGSDNMAATDEAEIAKHLSTIFGIKTGYTIGDGGLVTLDVDAIAMYGLGIKRLPVAFAEAKGDFVVSGVGLKDLVGCPRRVGGRFAANGNPGLSLQGAPLTAGAAVELHECDLESLEGIPRDAIEYVVSNNQLTSLAGISSNQSGISIDATGNRLVDLVGCPSNVLTLSISNQAWPMRSLKGIPSRLRYMEMDDRDPMLLLLTTNIQTFSAGGPHPDLTLNGPSTNQQRNRQIRQLLEDYSMQGYNGIVPLAARMLKLGFVDQARL